MASCLHPKTIRNPLYGHDFHADGRPVLRGENVTDKYIQVPCQKCLNCRTRRQNDWAYRMEFEYLDSLKVCGTAYFITFTYDDDHLSYGESEPTLVKSDVIKFHAKVRRSGMNFRFFTIGEYGGKFSRPH